MVNIFKVKWFSLCAKLVKMWCLRDEMISKPLKRSPHVNTDIKNHTSTNSHIHLLINILETARACNKNNEILKASSYSGYLSPALRRIGEPVEL